MMALVNRRSIQFTFLAVLFGITVILSFFIFKPYLNILILAATFAIIFYPFYKRLLAFWKGKYAGFAAFIVVLTASIIIFVPLGILGTQVFNEASDLYGKLSQNTDNELSPLGDVAPSNNQIVRGIQEKVDVGIMSLMENVKSLFDLLVQNASRFFEGIANIGLALFLWLLAFYYFLRDGHKIHGLLVNFSPLADRYDKEILGGLVSSIKTVIGGSLVVAVIQGILAGLGLWLFGVPNPTIWGLVAVIAALVPTLGTAIIMLPAIAYLLLTNSTGAAVGLVFWSFLLVGGIDNILRPKLIERGIGLHPLAILLSVLGGIAFFGPVGFLTGPIILSFMVQLLNVYREMASPAEGGQAG